ncbi:unnamed protein product, partial [Amoebophrya sp. A25]
KAGVDTSSGQSSDDDRKVSCSSFCSLKMEPQEQGNASADPREASSSARATSSPRSSPHHYFIGS